MTTILNPPEQRVLQKTLVGIPTNVGEDLDRGFEPDSCFYIQNVSAIRRKKRIDLTVDPPPDLIVEIDITSTSLDRFSIFAEEGVVELRWKPAHNPSAQIRHLRKARFECCFYRDSRLSDHGPDQRKRVDHST